MSKWFLRWFYKVGLDPDEVEGSCVAIFVVLFVVGLAVTLVMLINGVKILLE